MTEPIIELSNISTYYGQTCIHDKLNLTINKGEILAIVGGSGSGKTTLLRNILMLQQPSAGSIKIFGHEVVRKKAKTNMLRKKMGVMFQQGALFSSLTILENIAFPLQLHTKLPKQIITEIALLKLSLVGLDASVAEKYPAELSGGMIKRVAVARAIAMDPDLLFLDEPTAGLDPQSADELDSLIVELKKLLGLTIILVTHDVDTLWAITDRIAFLGEKHVLEVNPIKKIVLSQQALIKEYFSGARGRQAQNNAQQS